MSGGTGGFHWRPDFFGVFSLHRYRQYLSFEVNFFPLHSKNIPYCLELLVEGFFSLNGVPKIKVFLWGMLADDFI